MADAPVPITATRSPDRSWPWSHRAEWKVVPTNRSSPDSAGMAGSLNGPAALIRNRARKSPAAVRTVQRWVASSHRAEVSSAPNTHLS